MNKHTGLVSRNEKSTFKLPPSRLTFLFDIKLGITCKTRIFFQKSIPVRFSVALSSTTLENFDKKFCVV